LNIKTRLHNNIRELGKETSLDPKKQVMNSMTAKTSAILLGLFYDHCDEAEPGKLLSCHIKKLNSDRAINAIQSLKRGNIFGPLWK
jgi:hypothetical protein